MINLLFVLQTILITDQVIFESKDTEILQFQCKHGDLLNFCGSKLNIFVLARQNKTSEDIITDFGHVLLFYDIVLIE